MAVLAVLGVAAAVPQIAAAPAGAAPAAPGQAAPSDDVTTGALSAQPANTRWAREIVWRLEGQHAVGAYPEAEIVALGSNLGRAADVRVPIRAAALKTPGVRNRVNALFQQLLQRPADPSGLAFWSGRIQKGTLSYENLVVTLTISNEAWTKAGGSAGYVHWVYEHLLGRPADASGAAYWKAKLDSGTSRDRFARSFLRSPERARQVVRSGFRQYLLRNADSGGLQHWVNQYTTAKVGELDLAVALLASSESRGDGCGYDPEHCLLPFPNDRFTVGSEDTPTERRVALKPEWMPANASGKHINPVEWNRNDGYSPGQALVLRVPGVDLEQSGLARVDDIGASLAEDAPVVIWDVEAEKRVPYFAELDANVPAGSADRLLYIRPAVNYTAGHNYMVGIRDLKNAAGAVIPAPAGFDRERDWVIENGHTGLPQEGSDVLEFGDPQFIVRTTFDLTVLEQEAGMAPEDLYLAWDFTVASTENTTGRMLHIRDDALSTVGSGAPAFDVSTVTPNPRAGVAKRIEGTFQVPLYLTGTGQPGAGFKTGSNGLPVRNGSYTASYDCEIPTSATDTPARATVYGHGLFGSLGEVRSGPQAAMVTGHNMAYCATDWIGMAGPDVANAATILQDLSTFGTLPDRSQQGILNTVFLGRLLSNDAGFVSHPAFQDGGGGPLLDTSALFYDGNSQGAVIGGAYVAVDPKVEAGVLGVAGMNYSTLLERSVDFDPFFDLMKNTYPNRADQVVGLQLIQMLWDRGETNGYAAHLNASNNLPGTPDKRVLIHTALGDHQVATLTAEVEARTAGIPIHRPTYLTGRTTDVEPGWGLESVVYPSTGSALVVWDSGAALAPLTNVPPRTGEDPHGDPRNSPQAQAQKSAFLAIGGTITDVCSAAACTAPAT
ncbi:DUF4214 domain-containing protein [Aquihabitans daechungensis]|uniref:DUF4214 domain-containing protein n=1 Tax=Aquihabitans daechungensis TaxID=1052257 RepID=UPI003B9EADD1